MAVERCDWCGVPGQPYTYRGKRFSGLTACEGQRLCARCRDGYLGEAFRVCPGCGRRGELLRPARLWNGQAEYMCRDCAGPPNPRGL